MPHPSLLIGAYEVIPLCDGWAPLPLSDECPGRDVDWERERAAFPWAFATDAAWAWHVHAFLVLGPSGPLMVDTGIGTLGRPPFDVAGRMEEELAASGVRADEVRHVVHTHLHADHAGGACRPDGSPRFANALHHVHPADWDFFADADDPDDFNGRRTMGRLERDGVLRLETQDHEVVPGLRVMHTPGHTPGHRSVILADAEETLLLTGDLLHLPIQIAHPDWPSNHDVDPELACRSRAGLLAAACTGAWAVAVSHFAKPFGSVGPAGWLGRQ